MSDAFTQVIELAFSVLGAADAQKVADVLQGVGDAGAEADSKLAPLIDQFTSLAQQAALVKEAIDLQAKLQANEAALTSAKSALAALNSEFDRTDKSSLDVSVAFQQATKDVNSLAAAQLRLQSQSAANSAQLKAAGIDTTNLAAANDSLKTQTQAAATQLTAAAGAANQVSAAHQAAAKSATEAGTAFAFVRDHLKEIISLAAAYEVAVKSFEFGKEAITDAAAVEQSLSRVKAVAQGTADQFKDLDEQVDAAAKAVNVSSQTAAAGLSALVGQGLSLKGAFDALVPTLQLARIANIDVGQAAQDVAGALKAFNLPASDAQIVVDKLTVASHGAAGGLGEMAKAAVDLAPAARSIGLSFDQTVGILETLQSQGVNVSEAVRGLRTVFDDLGKSSSTLREQLRGLGDNTSDFKNAVAALTSGTPLANDAINTLSGSAKTLILALGNAGPDAIDKFTAALGKAAGAAKTTFQVIDDNLDGALTRFDRDLGDIGSNLAKPLLGPIKDELNALATQLETFLASDTFKKLQGQIVDFATTSFKALNSFIAGIDWDNFGKSATDAAGNVVDDLKQIATAATETAKVVNDAAHTISFAFQSASLNSKIFQGDLPGAIKSAQSLATSLLDGGSAANAAADAQKKLGDQTKQSAGSAQSAIPLWGALRDGFQQLWDKAGQAVAGLLNVGKAVLSIIPTKDPTVAIIANLKTLGLTAEQTGESVTEGGKKIIDAFAEIVKDSTQGANQIQLAFAKALSLSQTDGEVKALETSLQAAFSAGKISADAFQVATDAATAKIVSLKVGAAVASASLAGMGKAGQSASDAIVASLEDARNKVEAESAKIAKLIQDSLKAGIDPSALIFLQQQLKENGKVADGLTASIAKYSATSADATQRTADNAGEMEIAAQKAQKYSDAMAVLRDTSASLGDKMKAAAEAITNAGDSTEKQAAVAESARASIEAEAGAASSLAQVLANVQAQFNAVSQAAGSNFSDAMSRALQNIGLTKEAVSDLSDSFGKLNAASSDTSGFVAYFNALTSAAAETQKQIDAQKATVNEQTAAFNNFATSSSASLDQLVSKLGVTQASLAAMDEQLKAGTYNAGLLGQQDLAGLQQAVDATIAKVQALKDATKAASDQFVSLAQSVHDELLQQLGDQAALENERDQNTLAQLLALKQAGQVSDAQYQKALADEQQLHALKMADIAAQAAAQKNSSSTSGSGADGDGSGTNDGSGSSSSGGGLAPRGQLPASQSASAPAGNTVVYNVAFNPTIYGANDSQMMDLARALKKNLDIIAARSR